MRRFAAWLCAVFLAAAPAEALASRSSAKRQLEFGVEMALKGSWREAAFRFRKAVEYDPENSFAYNNLGVALESVGKFEEAEKAYRRALELNPGHNRIEENLQRLQAYMGTISHPGFVPAGDEDEEDKGQDEEKKPVDTASGGDGGP